MPLAPAPRLDDFGGDDVDQNLPETPTFRVALEVIRLLFPRKIRVEEHRQEQVVPIVDHDNLAAGTLDGGMVDEVFLGAMRADIALECELARDDFLDGDLFFPAVATIPLFATWFRYLFGGGDFAGYQGPFYSPKTFHDLVLPRLQEITNIVHQKNAYSLFASDGDLWSVADDLFGASGVDGFYEIDRRAGMDLRRLREHFPDLTLLGGISSHTLHVGSSEEVIAETLTSIEVAKELGRIIVGVTNLPVPGTPVSNIEAMLRTVEDNR